MIQDSGGAHRFACGLAVMRQAFHGGMGRLDHMEPRLGAALGDVLSRPGSLMRAAVAYFIGVEMGLAEELARAVGCGIEYLHTASMIFDDFPAMDDARTRRGAPCLHVAHGEGMATLAALALINRGYALIWQGIGGAGADRRRRAGDLLESCLGPAGLVGGQAHDLRGWREEQDAAEVVEVAARKTATLVRLPVVLPALAGHATEKEIRLLDRLAFLRGLAFQTADDLKDVLCQPEESGKTSGRDSAMGRPNLALAEGVTGATRRFQRLQALGDRVEARLPGPRERWWMLPFLRVRAPWPGFAEQSGGLAAG